MQNLVVIWLDLANLYESIIHKSVLLKHALGNYHISEKVCGTLLDYFNRFKMIILFSIGNETTNWLEIGIATCCTFSVSCFAAATAHRTGTADDSRSETTTNLCKGGH